MDKQTIENQYLKINKFFGQLVGVWPFQERFIKTCMRFIVSVVMLLDLATQISRLRELLNDIISDRLIKRSKKELEILELYSRKATTLCILYKDEQKYYYPILMHMILAILVLSSVYLACDTNLVQVVHHGCALLAISGYHFKHAVDDVKICDENYITLMDETYTRVRHSIKAHRTAVEYVDKIDACHIYYFLLTIGMIVLTFTGTFVKLSTMEIGIRFFTFCAYTVAQLTHLFFLTIMGQFLINANEEIFRTIYEAHWYNGSSRTQSLYVLVLRKCLTFPKLTGGGLITLNLDSFVQLSSMEVNVRFFTFCAFTVGQLTHLFFLTIMGQFLINANDEIFKTIYEAHWYNGSSRTQSLYILVLRKCLSPPKLTGGGLVALNLDSFLQILKASFSYYTVFRS